MTVEEATLAQVPYLIMTLLVFLGLARLNNMHKFFARSHFLVNIFISMAAFMMVLGGFFFVYAWYESFVQESGWGKRLITTMIFGGLLVVFGSLHLGSFLTFYFWVEQVQDHHGIN